MDALKKFFEKKKADVKFRHAGQGHSLSHAGQADVEGRRGQSSGHAPQPRQAPTQDARKAGAAALARFESTSKKTEVNWSLQAIKAKARREMEAEKKAMQAQCEKEPHIPKEVHLEGSPMLAVQGVFFHCPLIGPEVAKYDEIKRQIRDFLYSQMEEDKGISSCLIIHTCNKNKEKVGICIETLCKYIENITSNPTEEKFRKIRQSNKAYQERIRPIEGTSEFLSAAGFVEQELPFNDTVDKFWVFPEAQLGNLESLEQLRDALVSAEPLRPQLDRSLAILLPARAASHMNLPHEFFNLTHDELKREMHDRETDVVRSQMLMTKAMRERLELKEIRKYKFSLIRVRFPDGLILQGTFGIHEKFEEVVSLVRENIVNDWRPFFLSLSGGGKIHEMDMTLTELRIVPAAILNFEWDQSIQDPSLDDSIFLKPSTLALLQDSEN